MKMSRSRKGRLLCVALLLHAAATAFAAWPADQSIKIIVPQAPGGTNDTVARVIGQELAKALQQSRQALDHQRPLGAIGLGAGGPHQFRRGLLERQRVGVEDHTEHFRKGPLFPQWRAIVGPFFAAPTQVEHFTLVTKS